MVSRHRRRVGSVRPSHLMFTSGVGSLVDLPNLSVLVRGLDDWNYGVVLGWEPIAEPRLLAAVKALLKAPVKELRPPPWLPGIDREPTGPPSQVGVPTTPFPAWLRCTACSELAAIDSMVFGFENEVARRPHDARFFHDNCPRARRRKPLAVPARFMLSCIEGHLDDFPYTHFVHRGAGCPNTSRDPRMRMKDQGGNLGANVTIQCLSCGEDRNMRQAFGRSGEANLPACRARHPHLAEFEPQGCREQPKVLVVGASNQWFAQVLSALAVRPSGATELRALVEKHWQALKDLTEPAWISYAREHVPALRDHFARWTVEEIWEAVAEHRAALAGEDTEAQRGYPDLRTPEWEAFSASRLPEPSPDFTLRRDPDGVPIPLAGVFADVLQVERLTEVRALVGFTRLDAPDPDDPDQVKRVKLSRSAPTWVPATQVRGEGIFLRVRDDLLESWEKRVADSQALLAHREAYARFRRNRRSDRLRGDFDPMAHWPGTRYLALHTLSHLLIRTIALECGYSSASLAERIYAGTPEEPRSGILIYTAVPDAEGTLGGLVSLAEPDPLVRLTRRALLDARHCSSDPLCAERLPHHPADFLHGAACHVCLFVSETTCERGNRFLDRRFVVPVDEPELALYPEVP